MDDGKRLRLSESALDVVYRKLSKQRGESEGGEGSGTPQAMGCRIYEIPDVSECFFCGVSTIKKLH